MKDVVSAKNKLHIKVLSFFIDKNFKRRRNKLEENLAKCFHGFYSIIFWFFAGLSVRYQLRFSITDFYYCVNFIKTLVKIFMD